MLNFKQQITAGDQSLRDQLLRNQSPVVINPMD
jgi:hypothetical protein